MTERQSTETLTEQEREIVDSKVIGSDGLTEPARADSTETWDQQMAN